ncbi:MAG: hypothetical protein K2K20_03450 [Lachnospiraceae bacterium]|nr:hypothetical protein [Lachnospiraceae bacterium]
MDENQMNQMEVGSQTTFGMNVNGALETPPKKKTGLLIAGIIVAFLLLLGAGAFGMLKYREQQDMDASEEMIAAFMKAYGRLQLEDAYETFHPDVRDGVIDEQLDTYMMSSLEGVERYLDLYFGDMEMTYEIDGSEKLSKEELEDHLSEIDDSYDAELDISKAYVYYVTEVYSGENGMLKVRKEYYVGKEEEDWYIIEVTTDKIVKDDVSFSITDYLSEMIDEFMDLYGEAINECDGRKMEDAYSLMHPEMRDLFIEQLLLQNSSEDLGDFVEWRNSFYGGFSSEYEILDITYLEGREWNSVLRLIEDYFGTEFDFGMRGVWEFDLQETLTGSNGTVVIVENYFMGEEDGKWYIIDINTEEIISDTVVAPQPVYTGNEGYASAEEAIEHYMRAYEDFDVEEAFMAFHPAMREYALAKACYNDGVDDAEEYNEMINSLFGGSLTVTYTITVKEELSENELEAFSYILWGSEVPPANISDACLCLLEEYYEGGGAALDIGELIMAGKDGGQWFLYNSTIIPEDFDMDLFNF